jgi:rubrerythrin
MLKIQTINSIDAIKMSIQCEVDMGKFYLTASGLLQNDDALAILRGLTDKREKHRHDLVRLYSKLCGKKILYLNLGRKHKLNTLLQCPDNANDAISTAKKNEKELKIFYHTVSRRLLEPELRHFFRALVNEVDQYITLLESSFEDPLLEENDAMGKKKDLIKAVTSTEAHVW